MGQFQNWMIGFLCVGVISFSPQSARSNEEKTSDLSLGDIFNLQVVTSSRKTETLDEAPNTMYVITAQQIKDRGYHSLREVLRTIPGFGVFHKDIQFVAQIRGIAPNDNEKIALLINGHNIANTYEPDFLNGPIDVTIADRIEIIVGPGSILYGTDALLATINIITKKVDRAEANLAVGNHLKDATAWVGEKVDDDKFFTATATAMQKRGWDAWSSPGAQAPGSATILAGNENTGQLNQSYFATAVSQFKNWNFQATSLNESFPDLKHAGTVASTGKPMDGTRYERVDSFVVSHDKKASAALQSQFDLSFDNKRLIRAFTQGDPATQGESTYDVSQQTYRSEYILHWKADKNYLQMGLQGRYDQNPNDYVFSWPPGQPTTSPATGSNQIQQFVRNQDTYSAGLYAQDEYKARSDLKLVGAARVDKNSMLGFENTYFSPRLAAIYNATNRWITKIMLNSATRTPAIVGSPLNEVWGSGNPASPSWASNNPLVSHPEVEYTAEWQNILNMDRTRYTVSVYYEQIKDFISWAGPYTNVGNFEGHGIELSVQSQIASAISIWGNAAYSKALFLPSVSATAFGNSAVTPSGEMNGAPALTANLGVDSALTEKFHLSPSLRYFTHQPSYDPNSSSWGYADDRIYVDLTLTWRDLIDDLDVALQGFNILDNTQQVAAPYYQGRYREEGFDGAVQVSYRF